MWAKAGSTPAWVKGLYVSICGFSALKLPWLPENPPWFFHTGIWTKNPPLLRRLQTGFSFQSEPNLWTRLIIQGKSSSEWWQLSFHNRYSEYAGGALGVFLEKQEVGIQAIDEDVPAMLLQPCLCPYVPALHCEENQKLISFMGRF